MNLAHVEIDLNALSHNFKELKKRIAENVKVLIVLKANGYGLGAVKMAEVAMREGANFLGVARVEEAIELRLHGITHPILVFSNLIRDRFQDVIDFDLHSTISDTETLRDFCAFCEKQQARAKIQIKLTTGMNRLGVRNDELPEMFSIVDASNNIDLTGIFTHFASADDTLSKFTRFQIDDFKEIYALYKPKYPNALFHAANSAGMAFYPDSHFDMVRTGIFFYGNYPLAEEMKAWNIKPAVVLRAKIVQVKRVSVSETVGYSQNYTLGKDAYIATISIGYGDGISRRLSNNGEVIISGKRYPIVGNVSMDLLTVNVGDDVVRIGDDAILFGSSGTEKITLVELAHRLETIPYEILTSLSPRVERVYINRAGL